MFNIFKRLTNRSLKCKRPFSSVEAKLTHIDENGKAKMVNVIDKVATKRSATAMSEVYVSQDILKAIKENTIKKGDVFTVSKIAGILAAKNCSNLIPLCHPINITNVNVDFQIVDYGKIIIKSQVDAHDATGVEMEAMMAANVAALTIYDMCKALSKHMIITNSMLITKSGGKSGDFKRTHSHHSD